MALTVIFILCIITISQFFYIRNTRKRLREISKVLDEISKGNLDRRILANENAPISELVYKINEIVIKDKNRFIESIKSEKAYKKW